MLLTPTMLERLRSSEFTHKVGAASSCWDQHPQQLATTTMQPDTEHHGQEEALLLPLTDACCWHMLLPELLLPLSRCAALCCEPLDVNSCGRRHCSAHGGLMGRSESAAAAAASEASSIALFWL